MADVKMRCENCRYRIQMHEDGRLYFGCFHKPYNGEWVAKIERCPKEKENETMKHYTESISPDLAKKLKEKGMPMILWQNGNNTDYVEVIETRQEIFDESQTYEVGVRYQLPTYAEVFDWLMEREIFVGAYPERLSLTYDNTVYVFRPFVNGHIGHEIDRADWVGAATAAIEKALELI